MYEYSFQAGYKMDWTSPSYLYAGIRSGGAFVTPDIKLGIQVHKNISIEAGVNYRYNLANKDKWGLNTDRLNGLGGVISIAGNIPL